MKQHFWRNTLATMIGLAAWLCSADVVRAQPDPYIRESVQAFAERVLGPNVKLGSILDVSRSLRPGRESISVTEPILDPYGTLEDAYIFAAFGYERGATTGYGVLGIYRDGQIAWHSEPVEMGDCSRPGWVISTQDLNNDGQVEIMYRWTWCFRYDFLWIYSWDGTTGRRLHEDDPVTGASVIGMSSRGGFDIADVDPDGVQEVFTTELEEREDELVAIRLAFRWDGQHYRLDPHALDGIGPAGLPRDGVDVAVGASVMQTPEGLRYSYTVTSWPASLQNIDEIHVWKGDASIVAATARPGWTSNYEVTHPLLRWYVDRFPPNYVHPGERDTTFTFVGRGVPTIVRYFVQGYNGNATGERFRSDNTSAERVINNSVAGHTVGAAAVAEPFDALNFLDTLRTYPVRAQELGWLDGDGLRRSLESKLENARRQLVRGNRDAAAGVLQALAEEVEAQGGRALSDEAYALLKFNATYLIDYLKEANRDR